MTHIIQNVKPDDLPQGYDLVKSFYNYTSSLAVDMWISDKQVVAVESQNFPAPKYQEDSDADIKFRKYFTNGPVTYYAK